MDNAQDSKLDTEISRLAQLLEQKKRELEVEAALEKVRARTMSMRSSDELSEVLSVLFHQFEILNIHPVLTHLSLFDLEKNTMTFRMTGKGGHQLLASKEIALDAMDQWKGELERWKVGVPSTISTIHYPKESLPQLWEVMGGIFSLLPEEAKISPEDFPNGLYATQGHCKFGYLGFNQSRPATEEEQNILIRFSTEFGRLYQRFLDLKNAEAQAREAEIQLALERVRARTMAMQHSNELQDAATVMVQQIQALGVQQFASGFNIWDEDRKAATAWMCNATTENLPPPFKTSSAEDIFLRIHAAAQRGESLFVEEQSGEELHAHYRYMNSIPIFREYVQSVSPQGFTLPDFQIMHCAFFLQGYLMFITYKPVPEVHDIFKRFAKVFEQTYTRFLDLKRAEEQAREAQIQLSLERVRARAIAMHHSSELTELLSVLFNQFDVLGIFPSHMLLTLVEEDFKSFTYRMTGKGGKQVIAEQKVSADEMPIWKEIVEQIKQGTAPALNKLYYPREVLPTIWEIFSEVINKVPEDARVSPDDFPEGLYDTEAFCQFGYLGFAHTRFATEEEQDILMRFAAEFGRSYQRFLDLKKAEAQAREAEIQLALERVRARTMAMQKSEELPETAELLFKQFQDLGEEMMQMTIAIVNEEEKIFEFSVTDWSGSGAAVNRAFKLSIDEPSLISKLYQAWKAKEKSLVVDLQGQQLNDWISYRNKMSGVEVNSDDTGGRRVINSAFFSKGVIAYSTPIPRPAESIQMLERFADTFDLTYTRFLDLKKAEEQARESQIEAALEKVRSNSLAMHHSSELGQVVQSLFDRLTELGLLFDGALIFTFDKGKRNITLWIATNHLSAPSMIDLPYDIDYADNLILNDLWNANETGEHIINKSYTGKEKNNYFRYVVKHNDAKIPRSIQQLQIEAEKWTLHCVAEKHSMLAFDSWSGHITSDEDFKILIRFAKVFEQAYIRFLDLQKAEAQAREAQIEAALEKVRSRSLAMHKSEELQEVIRTVLARINDLGLNIATACIIIPFEDQSGVVAWLANTSFEYLQPFRVPWTTDLITKDIINAYQNGMGYFSKSYSFEEKNEYYHNLFTYTDFKSLPDNRKADLLSKPKVAITAAGTRKTWILLFNYSGEVLAPEDAELIKRFARVFEQSYTRFEDLQKAEAQAREAQIEAALERVRSRAMAMHSSTELSDVVHELRKQMGMLGQKDLDSCVIHLNEVSPDYIDAWAAIRPPNHEGEIIETNGRLPKKGLILIEEALEAYSQQRKDYVITNEGEKFRQWFNFIQTESPEVYEMILRATRDVPADMVRSYWSLSDFPGGSLLMVTMDPPAESSRALLRRFANVFGLAYRRFADLMKAEAQAREARIETSLERLRTKTMAMKNSDDVGDTVATMFAEFVQLDIPTSRCGILIFDDEENVEVWTAKSNADGKATLIIGELNLHAHDLIESGYYCWKEKQSYQSYFLQGKDLINYYDALNRSDFYPVKFDLNNLPSEEFNSKFFFPDGAVFAFTPEPITEDHAKIMGRFAAVFGQTYRRYLDLQKAEASAKEAIKQAALDRIRADIASMRTKQDLDRITPVIWNELTTLNIPFIRCGIFIINDDLQLIHTFLSNPEGKAIASFNLAYDSGKISDVVTHWRNNKNYVEHWKIGEFTGVADSLVQKGEIASREQYLQSLPSEGIYLHFVPFLQGMLYVGNLKRLRDDDISLLQAVAGAFSTAYARYEDFNKVESTLNDLRQTQKQLVQAEKMASLGELTAGIAHEIQNPLNFVNNFAEVNTEMIAEGRDALKSSNIEDAEEILKILAENSDKILQHGKRADAIVKGMLQHTRTSAGAKEPTDINALCDEYLRLAYHGLRAKDSAFNATMKTDLDKNIGKVNIIPQDMGRVLLNLVNNAFYAVNEKKKQIGGSYEPEVILSTQMVNTPNHSIIISVKDNGNGIPKDIVDKIFQPFFTTKPTGQGTGLGLSLSYDIVKAHNGDISVNSKEGEGTEFIVQIPA